MSPFEPWFSTASESRHSSLVSHHSSSGQLSLRITSSSLAEPYNSRWVESAAAAAFSSPVVSDGGSTTVFRGVLVAPLVMMMEAKAASLIRRSMV